MTVKFSRRLLQKSMAAGYLVLIFSSALFFYLTVRGLRPVTAYFYFYYGLSCLYENRHDLAYEEFLSAHHLAPENNGILDRLAFAAYSSKPAETALPWFIALEKKGMSSDMMIYYGALLLDSGNLEKARSVLEYASKHAMHPAFAHFYLGVFHKMRSEYDLAVSCMLKSRDMSPGHFNMISYHMALTALEAGNTKEASDLFSVISETPDAGYSEEAEKIYEKLAGN